MSLFTWLEKHQVHFFICVCAIILAVVGTFIVYNIVTASQTDSDGCRPGWSDGGSGICSPDSQRIENPYANLAAYNREQDEIARKIAETEMYRAKKEAYDKTIKLVDNCNNNYECNLELVINKEDEDVMLSDSDDWGIDDEW